LREHLTKFINEYKRPYKKKTKTDQNRRVNENKKIPHSSKQLQKPFDINFNYLNNYNLELSDWKEYIDSQIPKKPDIGFGIDPSSVGKYLILTSHGRHCYDYNVEEKYINTKAVEFIYQFVEGSVPYIKVEMINLKTKQTKAAWFQLVYKNTTPEKVNFHEWKIHVKPKPYNNDSGSGWNSMYVDLNYWIKETFGMEGWEFNKLLGFRLRGNMRLAGINMYKEVEFPGTDEFENLLKENNLEKQSIGKLILGNEKEKKFEIDPKALWFVTFDVKCSLDHWRAGFKTRKKSGDPTDFTFHIGRDNKLKMNYAIYPDGSDANRILGDGFNLNSDAVITMQLQKVGDNSFRCHGSSFNGQVIDGNVYKMDYNSLKEVILYAWEIAGDHKVEFSNINILKKIS